MLAGEDMGLRCGPEAAVPLMIAAAEAFLDERSGDAPRAWRIHELENGPSRITTRLTTDLDTRSTVRRPTADPVTGSAVHHEPALPERVGVAARRAGRRVQRDGRVALEVLVPLGRLTPAQLRALADTGPTVRLTPWRTAVSLDLSPAEADRAERALSGAGLITDPASPWAGVTACTGRPGCGKALADVQADARRWVEGLTPPALAVKGTTPPIPGVEGLVPPNFGVEATAPPDPAVDGLDRIPGTPVHWAGCERRCGLPRGRVVELIATGDGYRRQPE